MGTQNQQRRAEKKRRRQQQPPSGNRGRSHSGFGAGTGPGPQVSLSDALETTAWLLLRGDLEGRLRSAELADTPGAAAALRGVVSSRWTVVCGQGWTEELARHAARKLPLETLDWIFGDGGPFFAHGMAALGWLLTLRPLPIPPRQQTPAPGPASQDDRWLARVRALLAKAESTEFPEEAEALTAKAQELVTAHSLEDALAASSSGQVPSLLHMMIDDPYADAKSVLVHVVASANRGQAIYAAPIGIVTVFAYPADLTAIELLFTSLLVQSTRAMASAGQGAAHLRQPSFRRSFLISFASRIGERLEDGGQAAIDAVSDDRLLPVLRARSEEVHQAAAEAFPETVTKGVSVSNRWGWAAGRAAADLADLDGRGQVLPS